ncbi:MAG: nucleotidyltransferase domain-containing protein [Nanoarchaeota archaeon]|nr:nucleotidyltransferase domain-containing protein [Nanoarchaeota archaeon]
MDNLKQKYLKISQEFLYKIKKENKVVCALITGSYFNNKLSENSDIDIFIITQNHKSGKKGVKTIRNVKASFFINPLRWVKRLLKEEENAFKRTTAEIIFFSDCIYGDELSKKLKEEANKVLKSKLPKLSKKEIYYYGWKLYDKLVAFDRDIEKIQKEYLKDDLFWYCIEIYFKTKRTYKPHTKYILPRIKELDSRLYKYIKEHLNDRDKAIFKIVNYLQKELGFSQKDYYKTFYR